MEQLLNNPTFLLIAAIVILIILIYNNLNAARNRVKKSWANIDSYLQERTTTMETLLDTALQSSGIVSDMQKSVAELRSGLKNFNNASINEKIDFDNRFRSFTATAENYPAFQSIDLFKQASSTMIKEEKQIGAARRQFNNNVTSYNTKLTAFPTVIIAKMFGFTSFELFELEEEDRKRMTNATDLQTGALAAARRKNEQKYNKD